MRCHGVFNQLVMPWYYSRYGGAPNLCRACRDLINHNEWSRQQLEEYQFNHLKKMLIHAGRHTAYYKRLFQAHGFGPEKISSPGDLARLPLLTKDIIRAHYHELLSDNIAGEKRHESFTGGTTGVKVRFCRDNECRTKRTVFQWRSDNWTGWKLHSRVAVIWPAAQDLMPRPLHKAENRR